MNPLKELGEFGQSVWLDFIQRKLLTGGELKRMVEEDGLKGVTSNPAIFEKAIADSDDYDDVIAELGGDGSADPKAVYEAIATRDIQDAADVLRPVYDETGAGTATSAWRCRPTWPTTPREPWPRPGGFGTPCRVTIS